MAHVLFLTPYYPPEVGAPQTRISETAARLVRHGHRVTVLTTLPNYPSGYVPREYRDGRRRRELRDGVRIVRVWSYIRPNRGFAGRVLSQLSFGCLAPLLGLRAVGRPDVVIVESPPLFDAIGARLLAWLLRRPFIFTVADIWPESAVQLGMLRQPAAIWLAERLEWSTYRRAAAVWCVTAGIQRALLARGLPAERTFMLPNGVDTVTFRPRDQREARAALGWDDRFTVLYAGTLGLAHSLTTLLDAATRLRDARDIRFILVGDGAAREALVAEAERRRLENVAFLEPQPHARMPQLIAAADACLVSLRRLPLFAGALPSKAYEALACARPVLLAVDGEARELLVEQAGAAVYVEPDNPDALARAAVHLRDHPEQARALGERGRALVEARFDRDRLAEELGVRIQAVLASNRRRPAAREGIRVGDGSAVACSGEQPA
jgi:colanic acid biosynthesis glycosyl transferase WcaI